MKSRDLTKICRARNARLAKQNRPKIKARRSNALILGSEPPPELVALVRRILKNKGL